MNDWHWFILCLIGTINQKHPTHPWTGVPFLGQRFSQPLLIGSWLCCAFQAWLSAGTEKAVGVVGKLAFAWVSGGISAIPVRTGGRWGVFSGFWFSALYCFQSYGQLPEHCLADLRLFVFFRFWSEPCNTEVTFPLIAFNIWCKNLLKSQREMHRPPVFHRLTGDKHM